MPSKKSAIQVLGYIMLGCIADDLNNGLLFRCHQMVHNSDHDIYCGHPGGRYLNGSVIQMSLFGSPLYCNHTIIEELSLKWSVLTTIFLIRF